MAASDGLSFGDAEGSAAAEGGGLGVEVEEGEGLGLVLFRGIVVGGKWARSSGSSLRTIILVCLMDLVGRLTGTGGESGVDGEDMVEVLGGW